MADETPQTRRQLRDWCLRKLGAPVLEINVDEDQVEDRLSEGLAYFRDYHFDGVQRMVFKHVVTATQLKFVGVITGTFIKGEAVQGQTSLAEVAFIDQAQDNLSIRTKGIDTPKLLDGEVILGLKSGATGTLLATNGIVLGDIDNGYVVVGDEIIGVHDILPFNTGLPTTGSIFDINYQFALNSMHSLISTDLITYDMFKRQIALLQFEFTGIKGLRFNRVTNRIYLDIDWLHNIVAPDEFIIFDVDAAVDPEAYKKVYGEFFVREYCYALIGEQWGQNLRKYTGIALPGNVTLNGDKIYEDYKNYRLDLEKRIAREWQNPVDFLIG